MLRDIATPPTAQVTTVASGARHDEWRAPARSQFTGGVRRMGANTAGALNQPESW